MMKTFLTALLILSCAICSAHRTRTSVNSGWWFHKGEAALDDCDFSVAGGWTKVNLPHTWNAADAFDETPGYYRGAGWYAWSFYPDDAWKDRTVVLHFGGVNQVAEIYVNGSLAGNHTGGYTAFNADITAFLQFGKRNVVKVRVDNSHDRNIPPLNADFTFYGGIYRGVSLITADPVHFSLDDCASDGVYVETPQVSSEEASLVLRGSVANGSNSTENVTVKAAVRDRSGNVVAEKSRKLSVKGRSCEQFRFSGLTVDSPELWSPENPYLYTVEFSLVKDGRNVDFVAEPLGIRWFSFSGDGFMLNGEKYPLNGANRHQDFAGRGNALTDDYHREDYERIKSLGFNFVRLAHYPQAQEVYRTCDELGLLVWTEIPVVNEVTDSKEFSDNAVRMLREQIRQTYNHPSVILYGYMNEILIRMLSDRKLSGEQRAEIADCTRRIALQLDSTAKAEAPYRNTVMAIHYEDGYNRYDVSAIPDVVGYNLYFGWYYEELEDLTRFLEEEHREYPDRPIIVSEFGADADLMNHSENPRSWEFSEEYQLVYHNSYLKQFAAMPFLAGYALWNIADFGAEGRDDATPFINQKGLYTYDRQEKAAASLYRAHFSETPMVYIAARNYRKRAAAGRDGIAYSKVYIVGNAADVELFLDGESLGRRAFDMNLAVFDVPFSNGSHRLYAVAGNGAEDCTDIRFAVVPESLKYWNGHDIAVNVGSHQTFVAPETGVIWIPDKVYDGEGWGRIGGEIMEKKGRQLKTGISNDILLTECNPLFQTFVQGIEGYRFDVPDGKYRITMCFVENNTKAPVEDLIYNLSSDSPAKHETGVRQFSVEVNGVRVIGGLNIARDSGSLTAVEFSTDCTASDGAGLNVDFIPEAGKTTLSGIRIERLL